MLVLRFPLGNDHTTRLGEALTINETLDCISVQVKHMTAVGATELACGIRFSRMTGLQLIGGTSRLSDDAETMKILYLQGVMDSNIDRLSLLQVLGDMKTLMKVLPAICSLGELKKSS